VQFGSAIISRRRWPISLANGKPISSILSMPAPCRPVLSLSRAYQRKPSPSVPSPASSGPYRVVLRKYGSIGAHTLL
jgi:hypothetical protein